MVRSKSPKCEGEIKILVIEIRFLFKIKNKEKMLGEKNRVHEIGARRQKVENLGEHKLKNYIDKTLIALENWGRGNYSSMGLNCMNDREGSSSSTLFSMFSRLFIFMCFEQGLCETWIICYNICEIRALNHTANQCIIWMYKFGCCCSC